MNITPRTQALNDLKPLDAAHFTGKAGRGGSRNFWHTHEGGQLLYVIEGQGWVQARNAEAQRIGVGDAVATEPNEEHWHAAGSGGPLAHVVVNLGETRWLEASPTGD